MGALRYALKDPEEYGRARLSHVADTWKGKLDPAEYLNPGRHGEWTTASGARPAHNPGACLACAVLLCVDDDDDDLLQTGRSCETLW